MRKSLLFILQLIAFFLILSCQKEDIYERPKWLAGKLFTQIKSEEDLSVFARAVQLTGYDTIIDRSGSYTVFAPVDEAWNTYFQEHPEYNSVEDMPKDVLDRIVKFHIVQNPWSEEQLTQLDVNGWIDTLDADNDEPRGFKRETVLRDQYQNYGVAKSRDAVRPGEARKLIIVDTLQSIWKRKHNVDSRKYAPLFYKELMDIYRLNSDDYAFYFNRPFERSEIFFVTAKLLETDIFGENGFIHKVDRVVEPLKNAYQIMKESTQNNYSAFLDLINTFPEFNYNEIATHNQPGYDLGYKVDSLFDINYPLLTFNIINEKTSEPKGTTGLSGNVTIRYQHGLVAPTNDAINALVNQYLTGPGRWGSLQDAPVHIRRTIVNTHMAQFAIYPSFFSEGYVNGENDKIYLDPATIIEKQFGSNSSFIGVNEAIVPRSFSSITGPVYLQRGYSVFMYAIERSGLLSALKRSGKNYVFYVEKDASLRADSSLTYTPSLDRFTIYQKSGKTWRALPTSITDLRNLLMNQVGLREPTGSPRKEFIPTLGGNYLIVNNVTGEVKGSAPTTFGMGGATVTVVPQLLSNNDNGSTYDVTNTFRFSSGTLFNLISTNYPAFQSLLQSAGLITSSGVETRYNFLSDNEFYTVFIPSAEALAAYPISSLTTAQLKNLLLSHFIQGSLIFTDGSSPAQYYETCRIDEKSTEFTRVFTRIFISPLVDAIEFRASNGSTYLNVPESDLTNIMSSRTLVQNYPNTTTAMTYPTRVTNGVVHVVDKVLDVTALDRE